MALEPAVENCIKEHRAKARKKKILITIPVVLCLLMLIARGGMLMLKMNIGVSKQVRDIHLSILFLVVLAALTFGAAMVYRSMMKKVHDQYRAFSTPLKHVDQVSLGRWQQGLEAASLGVGIDPPALVPVSMPSVNTITFDLDGKPAVGVSLEALSAPLSYPEIEAIMAHEVAHVVTRTHLHSPLLASQAYVVVSIIVTAMLAALVFILPPLIVLVPLLLVPFLPIVIVLWTIDTYNPLQVVTTKNVKEQDITPEMLKGPGYEADIVADSIAAKIISEPQALRRAIGKMAGMSQKESMIPEQKMTYNHLFVGPFLPWEPDLTANKFMVGEKQYAKLNLDQQDLINKYLVTRHDLIKERLENLKEIEAGTWRVFEQASGGDVVTQTAAWE